MPSMNLETAVALVAIVVAAYGLLSGLLSRYSVSAAFAFVAIGALMGGAGLGILTDAGLGLDTLGPLAELTLALVLFSAASMVRIGKLGRDGEPVARLLAVGLPLTIAAGTLLALGLFPGVSVGVALIIGAALAPTDADLGQQVITDRSVPARVRRLLNIESGLNDGIAAPVVAVGIALATTGSLGDGNPLLEAARELGVAMVVGVVVGLVGRWALSRADVARSATSSGRKLAALSIALASYLLAVGLDSSGFIAAFLAGLMFGIGSRERVESAVVFTEAVSVLLSIVVWLSFGLVIVDGDVVGRIDLPVIVYAVLSLTVLRMIPVALSLLGGHFDRVTLAFMGWFGPRGLATIVFALLGLEALEAEGISTGPLLPIVVLTVGLSVVLHGFSARPFASRYGRYTEGLPASSPEFIGDDEPHGIMSMREPMGRM
jgi:NhaP-type Na+/H+ or K+/H+ antiporter